ncbi:mammalian cell entry domain-containing protein [Candidatus Magnetobacterium bavaricum]|uniref:Mammalian cell entry domain-containing protein n=1 Tax=Candidatus Magnetobacterium bavaricum TaxID=29290 RepID=A0A0F3GRD6_9BACT|nr:mammalian cell entry domain-containing protein [Candidatus Magnetobacterium bavaricum]
MPYLKEEIRAGVIVIAALTVISVMVVAIGGTQMFEKFNLYYVRLMNVAGLDVGSQVRLGGVRIGNIQDIIPPDKPNEPVRLVLAINKSIVLYEGTKAVISQIGFVGDIYLGLSLENIKKQPLPPGSVINSEERIQLSDLLFKLGAVSDSVDALLKDVNRIFSEKNRNKIEEILTGTNKTINTVSGELVNLSSSLTDVTKKLQTVLTEMDSVLKDNKGELNTLLKTANQDLKDAAAMIKSIEQTANAFTNTAGALTTTANTFATTSDSLTNVVNKQSTNLSGVFESLIVTMDDLQDILHEIKNKPWTLIYKEDGENND